MFSYYSKDDRTDRERYLERELEDAREAENRRYEQEERRREERQREREEMWRYEERQADSWPEAFQKQANLCWREHRQFPDQNSEATGDPLDDYFKNMAQANEKALEIWREVEASKQARIEELQKQIDAIQDEIRNETADKLEAVSELTEYANTAQSIRDDVLYNYLDW